MAETAPAIRVTAAQDEAHQFTSLSPSRSPNASTELNRRPLAETRQTFDVSISSRNAQRRPTTPNDADRPGGLPRASTSPGPSLGLDPLSQYINRRTSVLSPPAVTRTTSEATTLKLSPQTTREGNASVKSPSPLPSPLTEEPILSPKIKKGVKFLGRIIGKNKKDFADIVEDAASENAEDRLEGAEAEVFASEIDNIGYSPRHAHPPAYIKVRSSGKREKEFNRMFLAQELQNEQAPVPGLIRAGSTLSQGGKLRRKRTVDDEAIWATAFSNDGRYLAAGGQDKQIRVWAVLSTPEDRHQHERDEEVGVEGDHHRLNAPVFRQKKIQTFEGHSGPILDLCWSKNNFLLSTSMDKTVKLWHISRSECLCTFRHSDVVTSVRFHPKDDRFFLAGSLDSKLRLWSIPDKSVAYWVSASEMITAVAFTPDGKQAIAGCLTGHCLFYETEGLRFNTSLHVRSTHGKNAKGSKITGIQTITVPPENPNGEVKMLVTSNDSRVRIYNVRDKSLEQKFRGAMNTSSQIQARFSSDARYIIIGSEDGKVFIWSVDWLERDTRQLEFFEAHNVATTVTVFAPIATRQRLGWSGDPVYDLCNPPPVTLLSKTEEESMHSWRPGDDAKPKGSLDNSSATGNSTPTKDAPPQSPAYLNRSLHRDGPIIVTASSDGVIKVFRQDCAWRQRMRALETASIFSKRLIRRSSSYVTHGSLRSRKDSNATQNTTDRVNSWRHNIQNIGSSGKSSLDRTRPSSLLNGRSGSLRSISPIKEHTHSNLSPTKDNGGPDPFKHPAKSSTWPVRPPGDDPAPPLPSLPLQGQISIGLRRKKENQDPTPQPSRPSHLAASSTASDDQDSSSDESFDSAAEEPQSQSSPPAQSEPEERRRAHQHQQNRPNHVQRIDTETYWSRDAWRDQILQQANNAKFFRDQRGNGTSEDSVAGALRPASADAFSPLTREESGSLAARQDASRPGTSAGR